MARTYKRSEITEEDIMVFEKRKRRLCNVFGWFEKLSDKPENNEQCCPNCGSTNIAKVVNGIDENTFKTYVAINAGMLAGFTNKYDVISCQKCGQVTKCQS